MNEKHAAEVLLRRFGPHTVLARGAGRWSVIVMHQANWGSGVTITDQCSTISQAVSQAIKFAIKDRVSRRRSL